MSNSNLAQSGWTTTLALAGAALVTLGITLFGGFGGSSADIQELVKTGELYFEEFDSTKAVSLEVTAFDAESGKPQMFKVERNAQQQWVIPSHHNYPADAEDRLGRTAASVMGMKRGALETRWPEDHVNYGVVNPRQDELNVSDLEGIGTRITITLEDSEQPVVDVIIGNKVDGQTADYFVRAPDEDEVYITTLDNVDLSAKFADWINTDLLEVQGVNINQLTIYDYEVDETQGTLSETEISLLSRENSTADWQLDGLEDEAMEVDADALTDIVSTLDNFKIAGVRPKQEGLTADLALDMERILNVDVAQRNAFAQRMVQQINQDLLRRGFRLQPGPSGAPDDISLLALQGELTAGTTEGLSYRLYFGRAFAGSQDELEIGLESGDESTAEKEESTESDTGEAVENVESLDTPLELEPNVDDATEEIDPANQPGRYVFVRVGFDEALLGGRPEEPVELELPEILKEAETVDEGEPTDEPDDASSDDGADEAESAEEPEQGSNEPTVENANESACQEEQAADEPEQQDTPESEDTAENTPSKEEPSEAEEGEESEKGEEPEENPEEDIEAIRRQYEADLNAYKLAQQGYETEMADYEQKLADGKQKADELNRRFALWYYVIPGEQYDKLRLSRPQLIREKSDEPEAPAGLPGGLPGGGPGGLPGGNLPPGLNLPQ
ncbi:MAG: hypothetical protein CMJ82_15865 [Planctomycetaceae bacterium]|nr:hypothetical protein [Planctomycetaceae bacterium]